MNKLLLLGIAGLAAIAASIFSIAWLTSNMSKRTLAERSEITAATWVQHYSNSIGGFEKILLTGRATKENLELLEEARNFAGVFRFKLFGADGHLIFISDNINARDAFIPRDDESNSEALATINSSRQVTFLKDGRNKPDRPDRYAETYVPLVEGGSVVGVAELYVDVSSAFLTISAGFSRLAKMLVAVLLAATIMPIAIILWFWIDLKRKNVALDKARRKARAAEIAKSRFLASMSHEIRTPMNGVLGTTDLLFETRLDELQTSYVDVIAKSADSLMNIINDILDFSKIEAEKVQITRAPFNLHSCVEEVVSLLSPVARKKGLSIKIAIKTDHSWWVEGDEQHLRQCLLNLLGNALKFTEHGHIVVSLEQMASGEVVISVIDTGSGISEDKLESVFQDFQQLENHDTRTEIGTGLGLAITKRLMNLMGGVVDVQSTVGEGTTFSLRLSLPLVDAPIAEVQKQPRTQAATDKINERLGNLTVAVAEDNRTNQFLIEKMLGKIVGELHIWENGQIAVEGYTSLEPDIILMDVSMPIMSGIEATQKIRAIEASKGSKRLPIVALTASATTEDRDRCMDAGMTHFLSKPVRKADLLKVLVEIVDTTDRAGSDPEIDEFENVVSFG